MFSKSLNISDNVFSGLSTAIARSNALIFTILLHSVNFNLASLSLGRHLETLKNKLPPNLNMKC